MKIHHLKGARIMSKNTLPIIVALLLIIQHCILPLPILGLATPAFEELNIDKNLLEDMGQFESTVKSILKEEANQMFEMLNEDEKKNLITSIMLSVHTENEIRLAVRIIAKVKTLSYSNVNSLIEEITGNIIDVITTELQDNNVSDLLKEFFIPRKHNVKPSKKLVAAKIREWVSTKHSFTNDYQEQKFVNYIYARIGTVDEAYALRELLDVHLKYYGDRNDLHISRKEMETSIAVAGYEEAIATAVEIHKKRNLYNKIIGGKWDALRDSRLYSIEKNDLISKVANLCHKKQYCVKDIELICKMIAGLLSYNKGTFDTKTVELFVAQLENRKSTISLVKQIVNNRSKPMSQLHSSL